MGYEINLVGLSLVFIGLIKGGGSVYCRYLKSTGHYEFTYCMEKCCLGSNLSYSEACCSYPGVSEMYIGIGLIIVIVLAIVLLCSTYFCCKKRIMAETTAIDQRFPNTRTQRHRHRRHGSNQRNDVIPSVSIQVEPTLPPPYEELPPPPYCPSEKMDQNKTEILLPTEPPPEYSVEQKVEGT